MAIAATLGLISAKIICVQFSIQQCSYTFSAYSWLCTDFVLFLIQFNKLTHC
ncbi:MAG: hypothetical protein OFPI_38230 [Osedax symbiont Rs2]|nr:MAG: hypothetical protein OFPI_38230 [Osedax symbiont Rs2]